VLQPVEEVADKHPQQGKGPLEALQILVIVMEKQVDMRKEEDGKRGRRNEMTSQPKRTLMMRKCIGRPQKT